MNDGVNSSREQNPFISRQILERYALLVGNRVSQRQNHTYRRLGECNGGDLRSFRGRRYQRQIQLACHYTPNQLAREFAVKLNVEFRIEGQTDRKNVRNPGLVGIGREPDSQNGLATLASSTPELNGPVYVQEGRTSLLQEDTAHFTKFYIPSVLARE